MRHHGSCHCGRTRYQVEGTPASLLACNCSICSKRGYLLWFVPREQLHLETAESELAVYTFNTHNIKHCFCPVCGCAPFGLSSNADGQSMAAINARCLDDLDISSLPRQHYDGRSR